MISLRHTALGLALSLAFAGQALAVTTIPFWHSMEGELGKEVDSLAQRFNAANPDYKIVPVYKGNYEQSLSAGIAAFRTGNAPAILQVYEVGTATMMASKAIKPVYQVFSEAGIKFDESQFVPTVAGYYTDSKTGHLLSQPFNSSTPVQATTTLIYKIYREGFAGLDLSASAAQSVVLMFLVIILTVVQFRYVESKVRYQ